MLNEIVRWVSERKNDRRTADRKKAQFAMAWYRGDEAVAGVGTEISINGLAFATKVTPPEASFNVVADIGARRIKARLKTVRKETAPRDGTSWTVVACTYEGIAADDYDAIVRFVRELPEPENKATAELAAATAAGDDAYRLLPMTMQRIIVELLVEAGRIAPGSDHRTPLLRMKYLGSRARNHRFAVHSRNMIGDEIQAFDSVFAVDDAGAVTLER